MSTANIFPSSEDTLDPITKIKLEALRTAVRELEGEVIKLRAENSTFRINGIKCLTEIALTREYREQFVSVWSQVDIEQQMSYLSLLEWHTQCFAELVALKRRSIIKKQLADKDAALVSGLTEFRAKHGPKHVQATINKQQTKREKVITAWAKKLGVTIEAAAGMLQQAEDKAKQNK